MMESLWHVKKRLALELGSKPTAVYLTIFLAEYGFMRFHAQRRPLGGTDGPLQGSLRINLLETCRVL